MSVNVILDQQATQEMPISYNYIFRNIGKM